jgi:adenine-specific DNA-methyltransferase
MKGMGKQVLCNDYLMCNYATGLAFIENPSTVLTVEDVQWLLKRHRTVKYSSFVADTFRGYYFTNGENVWLDQIAANIQSLNGRNSKETVYKRSLALHSLVQACLMKRPFNLFHRRNLRLRRARVARSFGNKTTWERPFPSLFQDLVFRNNSYVFDNGRSNRALNEDALECNADRVDLVYIDPPYFAVGRERARSDYRLLLHFVEGLARYWEWPDLIDPRHRLKALRLYPSSIDRLYTCPRKEFRSGFLEWLEKIIARWPNAQFVISYKRPGVPSVGTIKRLLLKTGRVASVRERSHSYALSIKNGMPKENIEAMVIGR